MMTNCQKWRTSIIATINSAKQKKNKEEYVCLSDPYTEGMVTNDIPLFRYVSNALDILVTFQLFLYPFIQA